MTTPSTPSKSPHSRNGARGGRHGRHQQQQHYHEAPRHSRGRKREKNVLSIRNLALTPGDSTRGEKRSRQKGRRDRKDRSYDNGSHDSRSRGKGRSRKGPKGGVLRGTRNGNKTPRSYQYDAHPPKKASSKKRDVVQKDSTSVDEGYFPQLVQPPADDAHSAVDLIDDNSMFKRSEYYVPEIPKFGEF